MTFVKAYAGYQDVMSTLFGLW